MAGEAPDRVLHFNALGFHLRFETNHELVEFAARDSFGPVRDAVEDAPPDATIRLLVHDVPEDPEWTPTQPVLRAQGDHFYIAASRASVVAGDIERGFAFGFISTTQAQHAEHLRSTMVQSPFLWMVTNRTLAAIHSACVTLDGTTIMIRGRSDAGKTTLAYAAVREGFSLLAEDVLFVRELEDGLRVVGLPWFVYLKPDAVRFFPEVACAEQVERFNGETKLALTSREFFPDRTVECVRPGPMIFVERSPEGRNTFTRLGRNEALERLEATAIPMERQMAGDVDLWDRLLEQPAFVFEVGPDPAAAARALRRLCESSQVG